ncbi:OLC1v1020408C1 [Oldenlandia corymbosa var. corymbosa]|uniref:OLC1v1020408C1 n=1 Tax=Oldenlandia corymbosa var. corymbosa TaxID=529605 RepID=A0AAV1EGN0_OLDCO|nr:OLC1v1020408C1 [Oldenlandia corymbosa var. corymbosa]
MSSKFNFHNELDNSRGVGWNVRVRLLRVWTKMDFNDDNEISMIESVLIDEKVNRVVAEIKKDLIYKFQDPMKEGEYKQISHFGTATDKEFQRYSDNKYKIIFKRSIKIATIPEFVDRPYIGEYGFQFLKFADIINKRMS